MSPFIFSRRIGPRLARHLAFWGVYAICAIPLQLGQVDIGSLKDRSMYAGGLTDMLGFLPVYLFSVYVSMYYILPRYLDTRNRSALLLRILSLLAVSLTAGYYIAFAVLAHNGPRPSVIFTLGLAIHRCHANLITITTVAVIIKIMKDDYYRQQEHEMLAIENIANRLRLLKMQLHPRLLFSTLQSIYAAMEKDAPRAPRMILKLSDILSYLLYESDGERIALSKEVRMIENYVQLKKLEYPQSLDIYVDTSAINTDHPIPPGLFFPILEAGIEPASDPQQSITVDIELRTSVAKVYFSLRNKGQGSDSLKAETVRIALEQVKARLQSLLAGKFRLDIQPGPEELSISMELGIDKAAKSR